MTHWPAALNTAVSLIIGGALAMAGQALADRRARRREREARRETFLVQNFTAQQEALMKIQELVEEFSRKLIAEYFNSSTHDEYHHLRSLVIDSTAKIQEQTANVKRAQTIVEQLTGTGSEDEQVKARRELAQLCDDMGKRTEDARSLSTILRKRNEFFWTEYYRFMQDVTIHVYRSGSQLVGTEVRNYLRAATIYGDDMLISSNVEKLISNEQATKDRLQATIGKALKEGPFAEYP